MQNLLTIMRQLRNPETGCPWDIKQTHESLCRYLLEESAEAVDAIHAGDEQEICEELGDVLLQIAFHSVIAEEAHTFNYQDIETSIVNKMIRRHPHVFGDMEVANADEVLENWEIIKASEKPSDVVQNPAESVPHSLPALMRAYELGKKLEWESDDASHRITNALAVEDTATLLLACVDYVRAKGENPELLLRTAANKKAGLI